MSSIDQQFVEFVVKSLVSNPDGVVVERRIDEKGVLLELTVDPEDLGRVIGKRGATAQSLRTLLRALGTKNDARYNLKIIDNGVGDFHHDNHVHHDDHDTDRPAQSDAVASGEDSDTFSSGTAVAHSRPKAVPARPSVDHRETAATDTANNPAVNESSDRVKHLRRDLEDLDD